MQLLRTFCGRGIAAMALLLSVAVMASSMADGVTIRRRSPLGLDLLDDDFTTGSPIKTPAPLPAPANAPKLTDDSSRLPGLDTNVKPDTGTGTGLPKGTADSSTTADPKESAHSASADLPAKPGANDDPEAKQSAVAQPASSSGSTPSGPTDKLNDAKKTANVISSGGGPVSGPKSHDAASATDATSSAQAAQSGGSNNQSLWITLIVVGGVVGLSAVGLMVLRTWKFNQSSRHEARLDGYGYNPNYGHRDTARGRTYTTDVDFIRNLRS